MNILSIANISTISSIGGGMYGSYGIVFRGTIEFVTNSDFSQNTISSYINTTNNKKFKFIALISIVNIQMQDYSVNCIVFDTNSKLHIQNNKICIKFIVN